MTASTLCPEPPGGCPLRAPAALFVTLSRVAIGLIFLVAAYMKLQPGTAFASGPQLFEQAIRSFQIAPDWSVRPTTFILPWLEAICAVLLIVGLWTRAAATIVSLLLVAFTGMVIAALVRKLSLSCGCFGRLNFLWCPTTTMGWCKVSENAFMLLLALVPALLGPGWLAFDRPGRGSRTAQGSCSASA